MKVMLPSLWKVFFSFCLLIAEKLRQIKITNDSSFFILTAGFYVLHGYTSLKSVVKVQGDNDLAVSFFQSTKLNQVNTKGPAAVPYKDYANQTPEKNDNNNDCRSESQAKRNPVTTICKFGLCFKNCILYLVEENENQFTSACPTDQREDTFYKATTLQHVK